MVERLKMTHEGKKTALGHIAWIQHGASAQLGAICIAPAELSWCEDLTWSPTCWLCNGDRDDHGDDGDYLSRMIIADLVVVALDRRLFVCHVCHPLDCVLPLCRKYLWSDKSFREFQGACRSCSSTCRASPGRRGRPPPSSGPSPPPSPKELRCLLVSVLALCLNSWFTWVEQIPLASDHYQHSNLICFNDHKWQRISLTNLSPLPEFLKIKEKQKAFGINNGLRVHEVRTLVALLITMLPSERCYGQGCDGFHARHVGKLALDLKVLHVSTLLALPANNLVWT